MAFTSYLVTLADAIKTQIKTTHLTDLAAHDDVSEITTLIGETYLAFVPVIGIDPTRIPATFFGKQFLIQYLLYEPDKPIGLGGNAMLSNVVLMMGLFASYPMDNPGLAENVSKKLYNLWAYVDSALHGWHPNISWIAKPFERTRGLIVEPVDKDKGTPAALWSMVSYETVKGLHVINHRALDGTTTS